MVFLVNFMIPELKVPLFHSVIPLLWMGGGGGGYAEKMR